MIRTYLLDSSTLPDPLQRPETLAVMPKDRAEKIARFKHLDARRQSFGAGLLLQYALGDAAKIQYNAFGKPLCAQAAFNLSHSGGYIILSICKNTDRQDHSAICRGTDRQGSSAICRGTDRQNNNAICRNTGGQDYSALCMEADRQEHSVICRGTDRQDQNAICRNTGGQDYGALCMEADRQDYNAICRNTGRQDSSAICMDAGRKEAGTIFIGCDIEAVKAYNQKIAKRFFTKAEYKYLENISDSSIQAELFFQYWTRKESVLKLTGLGMSLPMDCFDVSRLDQPIVDYEKLSQWRTAAGQNGHAQEYAKAEELLLHTPLYFKEYRYGGCCITVCSSRNCFAQEISVKKACIGERVVIN